MSKRSRDVNDAILRQLPMLLLPDPQDANLGLGNFALEATVEWTSPRPALLTLGGAACRPST
jgi:hypothetical protein